MFSKTAQVGRYGKKGGASSPQSLKRRLDYIFSKYIRARDSKDGFFRCITCGQVKTYDLMDCGHFQNRKYLPTRWDERNAHGQCSHCNRFCEGRQYEHGVAIDKKHGAGTAEMLATLAHTRFKVPAEWYEEMIRVYREKYKKLKAKHENIVL